MKTRRASPQGSLDWVVSPKDSRVGWFGYAQDDADSGPFLSVWFYAGSKTSERNVSDKLDSNAEVIRHPAEGGGYNQLEVKLSVDDLQEQNRRDQDWFVSVIEPTTK